ncbi:MAG: hypothetical protein RR054_02715 [Clostridia bacterium]
MKTSKRQVMLTVIALSAMFIAILYGVNVPTANAVEAGTTIAYPFRAGENAFEYGAIWTGPTEKTADSWQSLFISYDTATVDISDAKYIAVQIKVGGTGVAGMTFAFEQGSSRYSIANVKNDTFPIYFADESGAVTEVGKVRHGAINLPINSCGTLLLPISSMSQQWGGAFDMAAVKNFAMTTNSMFNFNYQYTVGEIGYYNGEIGAEGTVFKKLLTLDSAEKYNKYFNALSTSTLEPVTAPPITPTTVEYPFRKGEFAFEYGATWAGPSKKTPTLYQALFVGFDKETVDLSKAKYIAVQYRADGGAPGMTYGIEQGGSRYSTDGMDGKPVYFYNENAEEVALNNILYGSVNIASGSTGMFLLPMDSIKKQFGDAVDLAFVKNFVLTTNSEYNWNYQMTIGEIGFYDGELNDKNTKFTKLLTLDSAEKFGKYFNAETGENGSVLTMTQFIAQPEKVLGDVNIDIEFSRNNANNFGIWDGGALGEVVMTTDTYGDRAVKLCSKGPNPEQGDLYTAITLADGIRYDWTNSNGVSVWARNDSNAEISFNLEIDCKSDEGKGDAGRFNVRQGARFYLYDVNTKLTYIYMTKPNISIPVGFEGWIRIPREAFKKAEWSVVGPTEFCMQNTRVSYVAVTIHSGLYADMQFSLNKIGSYTGTPSFASSFVINNNSIDNLMGLKK